MIDTIDNPGWKVEISLKESQTEQIGGKSLTENASESDWIICKVVDGKFLVVGDPAKLTQILAVFRSWLVDHG